MKTKEEFNLSDWVTEYSNGVTKFKFIPIDKFQDFIRLLKEELKKFSDATEYGVSRVIDKLAGEKLK